MNTFFQSINMNNTQEEINITIAEACGYEWRVGIYGNCRGLFHPDDNYLKEQPCLDMLLPISSDCANRVPDYCNDLNAIHDAVMTLPENKRILYGMYLASTCGHINKNTVGLWHISTATARHRAEAFLRTLGKWEE